MKVYQTNIEGLVLLEPRVFPDPRGYFFESYSQRKMDDNGLKYSFVQDNQSKSTYGVIRGLHFQSPPFAQTKLIRVLEGAIYDVAVDIRKGSPTYGKWFGVELTDENKLQLLVPKGFAHGFSVISPTAVVMYKCDEFYHPEVDGGIIFNDSDLGIDWKVNTEKAIVSDKDLKLPFLKDLKSPFSI